uniref:Serpentine receptor class gamma n=1 Tax=Globodera rostochiensis TaxID=31243 RepID=A0A914HQE4_GLORO
MALYIAEIVTIVRHKKFHNSFYALFVMRAIPVNDRFAVRIELFLRRSAAHYNRCRALPYLFKVPKLDARNYFFTAGHTFQANNLVTAFILVNRLTAIIMPIKHKKIWQKFLPFITVFVYFVPTLLYWPAFKMNAIIQLKDQNSTSDRTFVIYEAEDAPINNYLDYICAVFSVIFMVLCILLNICTFVAYKLHMKNVNINGNNNSNDIEKKLLIYALATFLGHMLIASLYLINIITKVDDWKTKALIFVYYPLILDTGTVVLSSWLLLWASGTFRKQLIKDFTIIRKINIQNNRVGPMEGPQNNNHRAVGGSVGHQLQYRNCRSAQQLPAIS